jgi:predicted NAD/FAD-dependent oxidoreductase
LTPTLRCAVVGAGIAGLACARALRDSGAAVTVYEGEAAPGGRLAAHSDGGGQYDFGAQYFTASDRRFQDEVRGWSADGIVRRWAGRIVSFDDGIQTEKGTPFERYVGVPSMARLAQQLAAGLDLQCRATVTGLHRSSDGWRLEINGRAERSAPYDTVLVALASELAVELLEGLTPSLELVRAVTWEPCWAVTLALAHPTRAGFDGAFVNDDPILGWVALDSSKPDRATVEGIVERWVLHARPQWSRRYIDLEAGDVSRWLIRSFSARLRTSLAPVAYRARLWRYATPANPLTQRCVWDDTRRVGMAGDWCGADPRVEGAFLSGLALADAVLR